MSDNLESSHAAIDGDVNPQPSTNGTTPRDSKGWDGKLRVGKKAEVINAEILSDPEYSDEDAPPVEKIDADDGRFRGASRNLLLIRKSGRFAG